MAKRVFKHRFSKFDHCGITFINPSRTVQSAFEDVNIHSIVERGMNSIKPNTTKPIYGLDCSSLPDYQQSLQIIADAKNQFEMMPPELREKFHNNPEEFLAFVDDKEKNFDEGVNLGIFSPSDKPTVFDKTDVLAPSTDPSLNVQPSVTNPVSEKST